MNIILSECEEHRRIKVRFIRWHPQFRLFLSLAKAGKEADYRGGKANAWVGFAPWWQDNLNERGWSTTEEWRRDQVAESRYIQPRFMYISIDQYDFQVVSGVLVLPNQQPGLFQLCHNKFQVIRTLTSSQPIIGSFRPPGSSSHATGFSAGNGWFSTFLNRRSIDLYMFSVRRIYNFWLELTNWLTLLFILSRILNQ